MSVPNVMSKAGELVEWVAAGEGAEVEERLARIRSEAIAGEGLDEREAEAVVELVRAQARGRRLADALKAGCSQPTERPPRFAPRQPVKVYSPKRPGFMRATREEGIAEELRKMREEASGTPFFGRPPDRRPREEAQGAAAAAGAIGAAIVDYKKQRAKEVEARNQKNKSKK